MIRRAQLDLVDVTFAATSERVDDTDIIPAVTGATQACLHQLPRRDRQTIGHGHHLRSGSGRLLSRTSYPIDQGGRYSDVRL